MMRAYAHSPSIQMGEDLKLCVEPGHRFRVAFYRYWLSDEAEPIAAPELSDVSGVEQAGKIFQSPQRPWTGIPDHDWERPWITFSLDAYPCPSGVYVSVL